MSLSISTLVKGSADILLRCKIVLDLQKHRQLLHTAEMMMRTTTVSLPLAQFNFHLTHLFFSPCSFRIGYIIRDDWKGDSKISDADRQGKY